MRRFYPVTKREITVCRDVDELNREAAAQFIALARDAIVQSRRFTVALSGGLTPKALYSLLASAEYREKIDWPWVHLFWGDERCVPPDHPESNFRMTREALLARVHLPAENIHRMTGEIEPGQAAAAYEAELQKFFGLAGGDVPRFDLIFLGLGEDGHTASLFPGSTALEEKDRLVATAYVDRLQAHRLTLTLTVINAAAQVTFLVAGQNKVGIVKELLGSDGSTANYPAAKINPLDGRLTWLIAADAAALLPASVRAI
jgi:6-phosphogluconolactonase